jgi:hypothetical protein
MDNSASVFTTVTLVALVALFVVKCVQDNIEGYTEEEARERNKAHAQIASQHPGLINQEINNQNTGIPTQANLNLAQSNGHLLPGVQTPPAGVSMCALNQPVPTVASSLLPLPVGEDIQKKWSDPACVSNALANQNMLSAIDLIGVNTTASSLKNSSQDLRGDIVCNPRDPVSVWNNSSITCTLNRPLTCYEGLNRPELYSCDWNKEWNENMTTGKKFSERN